MSYQQFQQKCGDCGYQWNAAFGIVGMQIIAQPPKVCPKCKSPNIAHHAHGWKMDSPQPGTSQDTFTGKPFPSNGLTPAAPAPSTPTLTPERFTPDDLDAIATQFQQVFGGYDGPCMENNVIAALRQGAAVARRTARALEEVGGAYWSHDDGHTDACRCTVCIVERTTKILRGDRP